MKPESPPQSLFYTGKDRKTRSVLRQTGAVHSDTPRVCSVQHGGPASRASKVFCDIPVVTLNSQVKLSLHPLILPIHNLQDFFVVDDNDFFFNFLILRGKIHRFVASI